MPLTIKEAENCLVQLEARGIQSIHDLGSKLLQRLALKAFGVAVAPLEAPPVEFAVFARKDSKVRKVEVSTPRDLAFLLFLSGDKYRVLIDTMALVLTNDQLTKLIEQVQELSIEPVIQIRALEDIDINRMYKQRIIDYLAPKSRQRDVETSVSYSTQAALPAIANNKDLATEETFIALYMGLHALIREMHDVFIQGTENIDDLEEKHVQQEHRILFPEHFALAKRLRQYCASNSIDYKSFDYMIGISGSIEPITLPYLKDHKLSLSRNFSSFKSRIKVTSGSALSIKLRTLEDNINLYEKNLKAFIKSKKTGLFSKKKDKKVQGPTAVQSERDKSDVGSAAAAAAVMGPTSSQPVAVGTSSAATSTTIAGASASLVNPQMIVAPPQPVIAPPAKLNPAPALTSHSVVVSDLPTGSTSDRSSSDGARATATAAARPTLFAPSIVPPPTLKFAGKLPTRAESTPSAFSFPPSIQTGTAALSTGTGSKPAPILKAPPTLSLPGAVTTTPAQTSTTDNAAAPSATTPARPKAPSDAARAPFFSPPGKMPSRSSQDAPPPPPPRSTYVAADAETDQAPESPAAAQPKRAPAVPSRKPTAKH